MSYLLKSTGKIIRRLPRQLPSVAFERRKIRQIESRIDPLVSLRTRGTRFGILFVVLSRDRLAVPHRKANVQGDPKGR